MPGAITISESGSSTYYDGKRVIFTFYVTCSECRYIKEGRQMQGNKVNSWHNLLNSRVVLLYKRL